MGFAFSEPFPPKDRNSVSSSILPCCSPSLAGQLSFEGLIPLESRSLYTRVFHLLQSTCSHNVNFLRPSARPEHHPLLESCPLVVIHPIEPAETSLLELHPLQGFTPWPNRDITFRSPDPSKLCAFCILRVASLVPSAY
jgi:hypothetical protein